LKISVALRSVRERSYLESTEVYRRQVCTHGQVVARIEPPIPADAGAHVKDLTVRQRRFLQGKLHGLNDTAAAVQAGYNAQVAEKRAGAIRKYRGAAPILSHTDRENSVACNHPSWQL
jgi:hypothetical protein